jgi:hypothetical protein
MINFEYDQVEQYQKMNEDALIKKQIIVEQDEDDLMELEREQSDCE